MECVRKIYYIKLVVLLGVFLKLHSSDVDLLALSEGININSSGTVQITVQANVVSSANLANSVVGRDDSGSFAANMITIDGTTTNPTDVATKQYVDIVATLGLNLKEPVLVVATSNTVVTGLSMIDGYTLNSNDRVLLVEMPRVAIVRVSRSCIE